MSDRRERDRSSSIMHEPQKCTASNEPYRFCGKFGNFASDFCKRQDCQENNSAKKQVKAIVDSSFTPGMYHILGDGDKVNASTSFETITMNGASLKV